VTEHPFPALSDLVEEYASRGRARFSLLWSVPVFVRRVDSVRTVEESRSFHTQGAASIELVEEALRRSESPPPGQKRDTAVREGSLHDPSVRVDDVIPLRKRPDASTFLDRVGIGRTPNVDVSIPLPRISKYHAYVTDLDGPLSLCDARSTFGTFVDGERLEPMVPHPLEDGAQVDLGPYAFRYHDPEGFIDFVARLCRLREPGA